ncbi:hypothetical protein N5C70_15210 [Pseudomonas juntendi]|jgi:hypothetical protein|uniref:Uncharacterized protein n=1 Tax=Pseudomonas juntendi TaxID=2666183 RepID=A0ABD4YEZ6_9PSED|nr:hypothetical protein [Pseudomonas juntendi]MDH0758049.1 hypothetical protein [Pseudomonas juntendi]MDH1919549.1 hypothetical protein [Pseudomonas juntendi]
MPRLVYGVGVRDLPYRIAGQDGLPQRDPCYAKWSDMLMRCYSVKFTEKHQRYRGCTAHPDWLLFSGFRAWMKEQAWQGMVLDKDLIVPGNKQYSAESCAFIPPWLNAFLAIFSPRNSTLPMGVSTEGPRFRSRFDSPAGQVRLGVFDDAQDAHRAYLVFRLKRLEENILRYLAEPNQQEKVTRALRSLAARQADLIEAS